MFSVPTLYFFIPLPPTYFPSTLLLAGESRAEYTPLSNSNECCFKQCPSND